MAARSLSLAGLATGSRPLYHFVLKCNQAANNSVGHKAVSGKSSPRLDPAFVADNFAEQWKEDRDNDVPVGVAGVDPAIHVGRQRAWKRNACEACLSEFLGQTRPVDHEVELERPRTVRFDQKIAVRPL